MRQRLLGSTAALAFVLVCVPVAHAQPGGGGVRQPSAPPNSAAHIEDPRDLEELRRLYLELEDGGRLSQTLRSVARFLERTKAGQPWWLETIQDRLELVAHTHIEAERSAYRKEVKELVNDVKKQLRQAFPPVAAVDIPNDDGSKLSVFWHAVPGAEKYKVRRRDVSKDKPWRDPVEVKGEKDSWDDDMLIRAGRRYQYSVHAVDADGNETLIGESAAVQAKGALFHKRRWGLAGLVVLLSGTVILFIQLAKRGFDLKIRKIAGLEAVDEAVGRATEMGRPIMFIPGIQDMNDIQTIAGLTILGHVARTAAKHDAQIMVPTCRSLVMTAAQETVSASCLDVGRPDAYDEKKIYYTTDEQFGYVAAVTGAMVREKPAACFYMGAFYAESLILAETANVTGAIQIAGTAMPAQLPFFVAACDYTLIGEEFFAASAYLSGEPQQLGSLKGQDLGKIIALVLIFIGVLLTTLITVMEWQYSFAGDALDFIRNGILNTRG